MANQLKMAIIEAIQQLLALRWSQRQIARELGIDRGTVARYVRAGENRPNAAIPPPGSAPPNAAISPGLPAPAGSELGDDDAADFAADSNAAISPAGSSVLFGAPKPAISPAGSNDKASGTGASPVGRPSHCAAHHELILAKIDQQLSAQRIWQDLVTEHGFTGAYDSVKRFVRRVGQRQPLPMRRLETAPGDEAQVDFGSGARVVTPEGKRRKTHVFRVVLKRSGEYLFEIIMRRYETRSTVMTSNRPLQDWGKLIGDVPSATAILDRFLHHAEIISITGKSYRLRNQAAAGEPSQSVIPPAEAEPNAAIPPTGSGTKKKGKPPTPAAKSKN